MPMDKVQSELLRGSSSRALFVLLLSASLLASFLTSVLWTRDAQAQAFCALRQPHRAQQRLFPESTSLETFTDEVTAEHRAEVKRELNFTLHQAELGLHTLYAVFKGEGAAKEHIGYLHVRSEEGEWGLIEITWALTPDLKVRDFIFQRCREAARKEVQTPAFKGVLQGKEREALRALLTADGGALSAPVKELSDEAQPLAYRLIRSALKTIAVTRAVWHPVVIKP